MDLAAVHSSRRGDDRVVYVINNDQRAIEIAVIGHRAEAY